LKAYSQDLRERVVRACDARDLSRQQIADCFGVSTAWIRRLLQRRRETGSFAAKPCGGGAPTKMTDDRRGRLVVLLSEQPDATLADLHEWLGAPVHVSTIARALTRLGWTVKKTRTANLAGEPPPGPRIKVGARRRVFPCPARERAHGPTGP
jgi:transposase